jgi:hypothetical protein
MEIELQTHDAKGAVHRRPFTTEREPVAGDKFRVEINGIADVECIVSSVYRREAPEPKIVAIVYEPREGAIPFSGW